MVVMKSRTAFQMNGSENLFVLILNIVFPIKNLKSPVLLRPIAKINFIAPSRIVFRVRREILKCSLDTRSSFLKLNLVDA